MKKAPKVNPNKLKTRDELMVRLINGATKSGIEKDKKKEASKKACRKPIREES